MIEEYPAFLRDNPCCVGGVDFITMVGSTIFTLFFVKALPLAL
jgi:hypothetical protein